MVGATIADTSRPDEKAPFIDPQPSFLQLGGEAHADESLSPCRPDAEEGQGGSNIHLMKQIAELEPRIKERNRSPPNYVEELGLDMP